MKNTTANSSPFKIALRNSALRTMTEAQRLGTTSMSFTNLKTLTRPPGASLQGAPLGTNAQAMYAQLFASVIAESRELSAFVSL